MNPEIRKQCEKVLVALRGLLDTKAIDSNLYHKGVVAIAYEYVVGAELNEAIALLFMCPVEYYRDVQPQQMVDDPEFAVLVQAIAAALVTSGYAESGVLTMMQVKARA